MIGWIAVVAAILYIAILFAIAWLGDRWALAAPARARPTVYALALSVYCTSWTFFGSVGLAAATGLDFLPVYIGPIIMFTLGYPILRRVVRLSKEERITSVADFLGARYGKSQKVAVVATLITVIAAVPYIALQLKAVSASVATLVPGVNGGAPDGFPVLGDIALLVALSMALFAILFGTRHTDATEHQEGMMLAVAAEAVVKLIAFLLVGVWVTFVLFDGPADIYARAAAEADIVGLFARDLSGGSWIAITVLSFVAVLLLPRQFHIAVVENNSESELRRAAWMFPAYLVLINLFVVPVAVAGLLSFGGAVDGDLFVLELPHAAGNELVTLTAFLGGLSAATAMVIVASVALAVMISNEIVVPAYVRRRGSIGQAGDMGRFVLNVRRAAIMLVMLLGYVYYRVAGSPALAAIGLLSFAAIAQLAPAFLGGLIWRRITARGAMAGMLVGLAVWAYTLLLPTFVQSGLLPPSLIETGPFGIALLRPQALFNIAFDPFAHGVFWSLAANAAALVGVSLARAPQPIERLQASIFVPLEPGPSPAVRPLRTSVTVAELKDAVGRYLGRERTERSFERFARQADRVLQPRARIDQHLLHFAEQLLASAIGAASSRLVLSLLLSRDNPTAPAAHRLLDDATEALHHNRDLLQTVLDQMDQGVGVFDADLRLTAWNRPFRQLLALPQAFGEVGVSLRDIFRHLAGEGLFGPGEREWLADRRMQAVVADLEVCRDRHPATSRILAVEPRRVGEGGLALTVTDITERVESEAALQKAKDTLEKRVAERTAELVRVNEALEKATAAAEEANIGKTRFIAAAGHDILQPLNAARLYASSLMERTRGDTNRELARHLETALASVEDIFRAVLDLSRLDAGELRPELQVFPVQSLFDRIRVEFEPMAREKGLALTIVPCSLAVRSDPRLLGRLLQNLVSNAVKYTSRGRVLIGCRRKRGRISLEVIDTGMGIPPADQEAIFQEFRRLDAGARAAPGLGLGLSIVQRVARVLGIPLTLDSAPGRGTRFHIELPRLEALPVSSPEAATPRPRIAAMAGLVIQCIDDDERILLGMRALLTGWGAVALTARNAKEALTALRRAAAIPDVLLVDYHLGQGNGLGAIAEIRWKLGDDIPAVLITADRSAEVRELAARAGIRVLNKPLKPAALRAVLSQWPARQAAAE
ncbi:MAG TPA: PAS domain-containing hybrid sensor histidine kinase/response regulator [Afifellaceae bacterium]|nr:PAS domain-containing hybrid sensor histidine kinase/response regulator [Afifellaceae bacterium]